IFFSSRRRHTRFSRDWSSDVCSSDLAKNPDQLMTGLRKALADVSARKAAGAAAATSNLEPVAGDNFAYIANYRTMKWDGDVQAQIGRASCRERVESAGGGGGSNVKRG